MNLENITIKTVLATFVVIFGMCAMVFIHIEDMVLGALIGFVGAILQYFFGSSTGTTAKDKLISEQQTIIGGGQVPPDKDEK